MRRALRTSDGRWVDTADVARELAARRAPPPDLLGAAFGEQRAFLEDPCRIKAALCTRRAGKSYGIGLLLVSEALAHPGASFLYMALTRLSAKRILHKDIIRPICAQFGIEVKLNETTGDVTFPNGSVIYMLGGDSSPKEAEKALGSKLRGAVIDEAASFRQDLEHIVKAMIRPALVDLRGWIALIGTPGNLKTFFWRVTTGQVPGWSTHRWAAKDNPHVAQQWAEELAALLAENPRVVETPMYRQMYLGEWAVDTTLRCYKYEADRNDVPGLPKGRGWRYVMGIDLGWEDPSAIVVVAYSEHDKTLYVVYAERRPHLIIESVAAWIREVAARYPVHAMVIDGAAKQSVEELRQRHELPLEAADKAGKSDAIDMMSSDLITERVKLLPGAACLAEEWGDLVWDEKMLQKGKRQEHPSCPNHCFVAGTMVETVDGPRAIEAIVDGTWVHTRAGARRVTVATATGVQPIWRLETADGRELLGTADHPVWTEEHGWIDLASLLPGCTLRAWQSTALLSASCTAASPTAATQTPPIASCASTSRANAASDCTACCGKSTTAGDLLAGSTCTTWTGTLSTTPSPTYPSSRLPSTCVSTCATPHARRSREPRSTPYEDGPPRDIAPPRAERGTRSTLKRWLGRALWWAASSVAYAAAASRLSLQRRASAACVATPERGAPRASTMSSACAPTAAAGFDAIAMASRLAAPCRVRRISRTGYDAPVYNLSVHETPEYFANGILVHNCADAGLYAWRKATNYAAGPEPGRKKRVETDEEANAEEEREVAEADREGKVPWWERDAA